VPVHNFLDDVSWIKGNHTFTFGTNVDIMRNPQSTNIASFSGAVTNSQWFTPTGLANQGGAFDPGAFGFPAVASSFSNNYDNPLIALVGSVNEVTAQYNYNKDGSVLAQGAPVVRHFADDSWEFYAQDSWKVKSNLTVTYGLRYSLFSPPWETNGLQVSPTVNLTNWFDQRGLNGLQGIGSNASPLVGFNLGGPANNAPGFYNWDYKNFAPRLAVAYSPSASSASSRATNPPMPACCRTATS